MKKKICCRKHQNVCAPDHPSLWQPFQNGCNVAQVLGQTGAYAPELRLVPITVKPTVRVQRLSSFPRWVICLKEADETLYWLELLLDEKDCSGEEIAVRWCQ
jgi:hypothetical protein